MSKGKKLKDNNIGFIIACSFICLGLLCCAVLALLFNQGII